MLIGISRGLRWSPIFVGLYFGYSNAFGSNKTIGKIIEQENDENFKNLTSFLNNYNFLSIKPKTNSQLISLIDNSSNFNSFFSFFSATFQNFQQKIFLISKINDPDPDLNHNQNSFFITCSNLILTKIDQSLLNHWAKLEQNDCEKKKN
eukprot:TRINITY_DN1421_c0_g1_i1.p2 TRINITY_DN1421_c0_g1~~TRINITY_DN1421_c0_g1_i1.p2  ORF type:complete len:149 (+),score=43.32 TRINITY_DN1421_c0_g1_i1:46-492(+)